MLVVCSDSHKVEAGGWGVRMYSCSQLSIVLVSHFTLAMWTKSPFISPHTTFLTLVRLV